jgi:hypothetical protein
MMEEGKLIHADFAGETSAVHNGERGHDGERGHGDDGWLPEARGVPFRMGNTAPPRPDMVAREAVLATQASAPEQEMTESSGPVHLHSSSQRGHGEEGLDSSSSPSTWMEEQWESNYKEAAIFLEEGVSNQKFTHHPRTCRDLPAYLMVHNAWFHLIDLTASLVLLALGLVEPPCVSPMCVPPQVHSSIEIGVLALVGVQVFLRSRLAISTVGFDKIQVFLLSTFKCCFS